MLLSVCQDLSKAGPRVFGRQLARLCMLQAAYAVQAQAAAATREPAQQHRIGTFDVLCCLL